jgi:hypothetical protein
MPMDLKKQEQARFQAQKYLQKTPGHFEEQMLESPHDMLLEEFSRDALMHWQAPEFEYYEKSARFYLISTIILAAIVIYAVITNSIIMAITFILIGIVGYIYLQREPQVLNFVIIPDGIAVGREIYEFDDMQSFWIFYDPPHEKILSLHMKGKFVPYVHIPIHNENPVSIRHILLDYVPEIKQDHTIVDAVERMLHL